jgi:hypothetical protein
VAIKALDLIGKAMHPTHLGAPYVLRQRDELLGILLEYVAPTVDAKKSSSPRKDELGVPHAVRIAGLNAIATYTYPPDPCPCRVLFGTRTRARRPTDKRVCSRLISAVSWSPAFLTSCRATWRRVPAPSSISAAFLPARYDFPRRHARHTRHTRTEAVL